MGLRDAARHSADVSSLADDMWRLSRVLERMRTAKAAEHPSEFAASMLLCTLARGGPMRTGALADAVHSDASTVSRQVAGLVEAGMIARQADPADGRAAVLAVTDSGTARAEDTVAQRDAWFAGLLADWSPTDLRTLAALLSRLVDDFEPAADAVPARVS